MYCESLQKSLEVAICQQRWELGGRKRCHIGGLSIQVQQQPTFSFVRKISFGMYRWHNVHSKEALAKKTQRKTWPGKATKADTERQCNTKGIFHLKWPCCLRVSDGSVCLGLSWNWINQCSSRFRLGMWTEIRVPCKHSSATLQWLQTYLGNANVFSLIAGKAGPLLGVLGRKGVISCPCQLYKLSPFAQSPNVTCSFCQ